MPTLKTKITTTNLNETHTFYQKVFGLVVVEEWDEDGDKGVILGFEGGHKEALLEIYHSPTVSNFSGLSLQFRVDSLSEFLGGLSSEIAFDGPTPRPWGSTYVYLEDPNGIRVIIYDGGW